MKKIFAAGLLLFSMVSCGQKNKKLENFSTETQKYSTHLIN